MSLTNFRQPPRILAHQRNQDRPGSYPAALEELFPREITDEAIREIRQWPGHAPTPLRDLDRHIADLESGRQNDGPQGPASGQRQL